MNRRGIGIIDKSARSVNGRYNIFMLHCRSIIIKAIIERCLYVLKMLFHCFWFGFQHYLYDSKPDRVYQADEFALRWSHLAPSVRRPAHFVVRLCSFTLMLYRRLSNWNYICTLHVHTRIISVDDRWVNVCICMCVWSIHVVHQNTKRRFVLMILLTAMVYSKSVYKFQITQSNETEIERKSYQSHKLGLLQWQKWWAW